jgi:hypothetical protein
VRAAAPGRVPAYSALVPFGAEVELVLAGGGEVVASVDDPKLARALRLEFVLRMADGEVDAQTSSNQDRGVWSWDGVPPGVVTLEVAAGHREPPLFAIGGIEVRAGERTNDPRLVRICIRDWVRIAHARVRGPSGAALEGAWLWRFTEHGGRGAVTDALGEAYVPLPLDGSVVAAWVVAGDLRPVYVPELCAGDLDVQMQSAGTLRLRVGPLPAGSEDALLAVAFTPSFDSPVRWWPVAADGTVTCPLPPAGRFRVELRAGAQQDRLIEFATPLEIPELYDGRLLGLRLDDAMQARLSELLAK